MSHCLLIPVAASMLLLAALGCQSSSPRILAPATLMNDISVIPDGVVSRAITQENPTGEPGKGGMAKGGRKGAPCRGGIMQGNVVTLMDVDGCGVIRHIWLTMPDRDPLDLRNLIIRMYWDNNPVPSVEAPLGDFFGLAHGRTLHLDSTWLKVINGRGFNCYFPMPFRTHARITIEHDIPAKPEMGCIFYQIDYELHTSLPDNAGYFHAQFRRQNPTIPRQDYVLLDNVKGPGCFVGCVIGIRPLEPHWWGEGEMKFYFDGDTNYPTICGTGTEDYFCNAWGMDLFQTDYVGCTLMEAPGENNGGHEVISMYRQHVLDPVYFQREFKATIQQMGWFPQGLDERSGDDWCSVAYWYQMRPNGALPPLPDRKGRSEGIVAVIPEDETAQPKRNDNQPWQ